jgi:hypothetical protein
MTRSLFIGIVAVLIVVGAFFVGKKFAPVRQATGFSVSSKLTNEMTLGVARSDIAEIVEVCPKGNWLIFHGSGRALLVGANRFHYAIAWNPTEDIKATKVPTAENQYDLKLAVRKVTLTMDPDPSLKAYVVDRSLLVNVEREMNQLKVEMFKRLATTANNKLSTDEGRQQLEEAVRNHLYRIYASEDVRIGSIVVDYAKDAVPPVAKFSFPVECTEQIVMPASRSDAPDEAMTGRGIGSRGTQSPNQLKLEATSEGVNVYRWQDH